jgi:hypothetical protein
MAQEMLAPPTMLAALRRRVSQLLVGTEVLLLTGQIATKELESPMLVGTCAVAGTLILAYNVYLEWGLGGAIIVVVMLINCFAVLQYRLERKIESMEKCAKRFEARVKSLTHGLRGDALGPNSRAPTTVLRQSSSNLTELMAQAAALKDDFENIVVEPLSQLVVRSAGSRVMNTPLRRRAWSTRVSMIDSPTCYAATSSASQTRGKRSAW